MSLWAIGSAPEHERALRVMGGAGIQNRSDSRTLWNEEQSEFTAFEQAQRSVHKLLRHAQPSAQALRSATLLCGVIAIAATLCAIVLQSATSMLLVPITLVIAVWWLRGLAFRRAEAFERDYPALLLALASSIRTGIDPLVALQGAQDLFPASSELGQELRAFVERLEDGCTEEVAVREFGATIEHPDVKLFQTAFLLARTEGSSLSGCLQRLARVTRNRQSFRRKMRAAIAMQKLSSLGIAGCALVIVSIQGAMNFEALRTAASHAVGAKMLTAGAILMIIGLVAMLRMSRARI